VAASAVRARLAVRARGDVSGNLNGSPRIRAHRRPALLNPNSEIERERAHPRAQFSAPSWKIHARRNISSVRVSVRRNRLAAPARPAPCARCGHEP
jgi:hypothetical protein